MSLNTVPGANHLNRRNLVIATVIAIFAIGAFASFTVASAQSTPTTTTSEGTSSMHHCPNMGSSSTPGTTSVTNG